MTKRVALAVVTTAVALLLLTAFSLQSVLYSQIIQQQSSYAQEPASPITDGNASSSPPSPGNSSSSSNSSPFVEPGPPLPVEPDGGPGGQPGEPGGPTTEPQQQPQTVDNNNLNLTKTDGILTATINGANFVRNQIIEVKGKVDDEVITPESGVWISINDSTNETTYAVFASINPADKSFSEILVAGYYDGNSYGFYKPMTVSGKNYTMTVAYNTDNGPSSTPSGNNKSSSEVQFVFAYNHSSTTPPFSAAVTAEEEEEEEDTGPASAASQFAGNQSSTTTTTTTTNMSTPTTTTTARQTTTTTTKTNGLLTATINSTRFTTNQMIAVNGTVGEAAGPFIAVYVELKDTHNDTLAFEFAPIARNNKSGSDNETSFSYSLVAGDVDDGSQDDAASSDSDTRRFWKPMNETGNNYTMIVGYATPAPSSPSSSSDSAEENFRSEVQFVFAYEHLLPPEEEGAAVATTTTTTTPEEELESEPEPVIEPEPEPEEEESEDDGDDDNGGGDDSGDDGEDCDNSYPDECIPPPPPDLDCSDIDEDDFVVRGSDPHGFDDDNDGVGCEEDSSSSSNDDSSSSSSDDDDNNDDNDVEIDRNSISNALTNILDDIFGERLDIAADRVKNSVLDRITEDKAQIGQTIEQIAEQIADATDTD